MQNTILAQTLNKAVQLVQRCFKPHCKVSIVVRNPEVEDGNLVFTDDTLEAIEETVRHEREKQTQETDA